MPDFVAEVKEITNNDSSKFMCPTAKGVDENLIRQEVHEDIHYFSNKMRKG